MLYLLIPGCPDLYLKVVIHHIDISMLAVDANKFAYCSTNMHHASLSLALVV